MSVITIPMVTLHAINKDKHGAMNLDFGAGAHASTQKSLAVSNRREKHVYTLQGWVHTPIEMWISAALIAKTFGLQAGEDGLFHVETFEFTKLPESKLRPADSPWTHITLGLRTNEHRVPYMAQQSNHIKLYEGLPDVNANTLQNLTPPPPPRRQRAKLNPLLGNLINKAVKAL